jgi:hypothetical protein
LSRQLQAAGRSAAYFERLRLARSKPITYDARVAARLWDVSERLTAQPALRL